MSSTETKWQEAVEEILEITHGGEGINVESLPLLLEKKPNVVAYDGFEPSGRMHICQGLVRALNTNRLTRHGVYFKFWIADWFAQMNHKMGGDLKKIQKAGQLMIETWKACGMDMEKVEFIWSSSEINQRSSEYLPLMIDIATKMSLKRVLRCTQIMGRKNIDEEVEQLQAENRQLRSELATIRGEEIDQNVGEERTKEPPLSSSQIFYPVMQCADIFFLKCDICSLGLDQRKVNMMALEYAGMTKKKFKPIILSHHMLIGLDGSTKMSKSNPDNAIFMDDSAAEVKRKIKQAYCKPGEIDPNPMLEYCEYIIFPILGQIEIKRKEEHGGDLLYTEIETMTADFAIERLHPADLKTAVIRDLNRLLQPVRDHFENNPEAKQLLKQVKQYTKQSAKK